MPPLVLKSLDYRPRWPPVTPGDCLNWSSSSPTEKQWRWHKDTSASLLILVAYVTRQPSGLWVGDAVVKESTGGLLAVHDSAGWFSSKAGKTPFLRKLEWKFGGSWRARGVHREAPLALVVSAHDGSEQSSRSDLKAAQWTRVWGRDGDGRF